MARNSLGVVSQVSVRPVFEPFLLAVLFGLALAWPLRSPPIEHHGEAREGLVAQAIVDRGEWVLPRRNGELPSKPPLFHWLAAIGAALFGWSDAVLRSPSAIAAWAAACCTFALGCAAGGRRNGWLAVGALVGMVPFLNAAVVARVDMLCTACIATALTAFFSWYRYRSQRARTLVYLAVTAAVLAKGPVGAALPALVIVVFLAVERELQLLRDFWSWPLVCLTAIVDVGWYVLAALEGGREFVALQLVRENWSRFVGSHEFQRTARGHTLRMSWVLGTQYLPWTLALGWCAIRRIRGHPTDALDRFLHVWWLVVLGVFTVGAGKRPVYLLPAAPAIAVVAGRMLMALDATAPGTRESRVRVAHRISLARAVVALAIFDLVALATLQIVRETKARRPTLPAFSAAVGRVVPEHETVAATSIRWSDRMVLAYRLRRPVRQLHPSPGTPYLVPAAARVAEWCAGSALIAESGDGPHDFALMRAAVLPAGGRRTDEICGDSVTAGNGRGQRQGLQAMAGSAPRVLLPLADPSPVPSR